MAYAPSFFVVIDTTRNRIAGEVYRVLAEHTHTTDPKNRRYVLLHDCTGDGGFATLAYSSTKDTEKTEGAEAQIVHGSWMGIKDCGFSRRTHVYTSRLLPVTRRHLNECTGDTGKCWEKIRDSLNRALGLGKGTALRGEAKGSMRGCVLELTYPIAQVVFTHFAVVLTEPVYSKKQRYQVVVPLYADPGKLQDGDLVIEGEPWFGALSRGGSTPSKLLVDPSLMLSVFQKTEVSRPLPAVVDPVSMAAIEDRLRKHFAL